MDGNATLRKVFGLGQISYDSQHAALPQQIIEISHSHGIPAPRSRGEHPIVRTDCLHSVSTAQKSAP